MALAGSRILEPRQAVAGFASEPGAGDRRGKRLRPERGAPLTGLIALTTAGIASVLWR